MWLNKKNNQTYNDDVDDQQITTLAMIYKLPLKLVSKIYSQKKTVHPVSLFGRNPKPVQVNYSQEEYKLMLKGANLAIENPQYLGRALPNDHPKSKEIQEMLVKLGVSIQYHPMHGMVIIDEKNYDSVYS
jgi:hypothetical protein